jgi:hypothetical protein
MQVVPDFCPRCHTQVRPTDYYCFNCGFNLHPAPPSLGTAKIIILFLKSFLIPPLGLWYALPYLKNEETKSKIIGIVAIILTFLSLYIAVKLTQNLINTVNQQVDQTMSLYNF